MDDDDDILSDAEFEEATRRGEESMRTEPHAASAYYDAENQKLVVELTNGSTFIVPTHLIQSVRDLTPEQIAAVEVSPAGYGLHWEAANFDITVPGLVSGMFGSRKYMDALWASRAGSVSTPAKAAAARANGAKGGRPRKAA